MTPDTHFIIDFHPGQEGVLIVGGCSGHLYKHGPVIGDFAAGIAMREVGHAGSLQDRKEIDPVAR